MLFRSLLVSRFFSLGKLAPRQSSSPKNLRLRVGRPCSPANVLHVGLGSASRSVSRPLALTLFGDRAATILTLLEITVGPGDQANLQECDHEHLYDPAPRPGLGGRKLS